MKLLKSLFRKSVEEAPAEIIPASEIISLPEMLLPPVELPLWLKQEEQLRDEGVIYGLSGTAPDEKLKMINATVDQSTASLEQLRLELNEKIGELNLSLEKKSSQQQELQARILHTLSTEPAEEHLVRIGLGILLATAMCGANYYLIREGLQYSFGASAPWVAWGVFLAGMFSVYHTTALIHGEEKVTWRRALEEFGMPFAASLFIFVQVWPHLTWYKASAFLLFTLFLFLISGKMLLSSISLFKTHWHRFRKNQGLAQEKNEAKTSWPQEIAKFERDMENIRIQKWKIVNTLNEVEAQLQQVKAEGQIATNLFMSEYNLAQEYRGRLSRGEISKILNK